MLGQLVAIHYHKMVVYKTCIKTNLDVKLSSVILDFEPSRTSLLDTFKKGAKMTQHFVILVSFVRLYRLFFG